MSPLHPESLPGRELAGEITAINRSFLALLTDPAVAGQASLCGLNAGVLTRLRQLDPAQLDALAQAPVLLAGFGLLPGATRAAIPPDCQVADSGVPRQWSNQALQFANRLLTSLWHYSRQADGITEFCIGLDNAAAAWLAGLSFVELCERADAVCASLQARHAGHPGCWPDLVASARAAQPARLAAAQLSLIPLTVAANCSGKV